MAGTTRTNEQTNDFYETPRWCIERLKPLIDWSKVDTYHEPCLGSGVLYDLIPVTDKSFHEIELGLNYLTDNNLRSVDLVLTNPPFKLAIEFIEKAKTHASTVIMLVKVDLLGGANRQKFWKHNKPSNMIIMTERPSFTGKGSDSCVYCWMVWGDHSILKSKEPFQFISRDHS